MLGNILPNSVTAHILYLKCLQEDTLCQHHSTN
nr:MAG TPA: hypothetical protein [Bacteriophage sp.]